MKAQVKELETTNEALSKHRRAKKRRIQVGGPLNIYEATDILADKDVQAQLEEEIQSGSGRSRRRAVGPRYCSNYSKTGHNSRTCQEDVEMDDESDSE